MTIVDRVHAESNLPDRARAYGRDSVTLGWEARTHVHGRRTTDGGVAFGMSLARGAVLNDGDLFLLDEERLVVRVAAQVEAVFVVEPRHPHEWALFAYHIGNRHQPVMITGTALVCPEEPGVEQLLRQHHMPYRRAMQPFTPVATVAGHRH
jgi:urease accessory protein UreE